MRSLLYLASAVALLFTSVSSASFLRRKPYIPPTPDVTPANLAKAKKVLESGKDDSKYLWAVQVIVASEIPEQDKHKVLAKLFLDKKRMLGFDHITRKPGHYSNCRDSRDLVFLVCTEKLKSPSKFYADLSKNSLYDFAKETRELRPLHFVFFPNLHSTHLRLPPKERDAYLRNVLLPLCKKVANWRMVGLWTIAKHGDDKLLRETLETLEKWSKDDQEESVPGVLAPHRTRPMVLEFMMDQYFSQDFNRLFRDGLLKDKQYLIDRRIERLPDYSKVADQDAAACLKQFDRLWAIRDKLAKLEEKDMTEDKKMLPERQRRWSAENAAQLEKIRAVLAKKAEEYKKTQK